MNCKDKKTAFAVTAVLALIIVAHLCSLVNKFTLSNGTATLLSYSALSAAKCVILTFLPVLWCLSVKQRIVHPKTLRFVSALGIAFTLAQFISLCNFELVFWEKKELCLVSDILSVITLATVLLLFVSLIKHLKKAQNKKELAFALVTLCLTAVFWSLRFVLRLELDLITVNAMASVLFFETAVHAKVIHTNSVYKELFSITSLPLQIVDGDYKTCFTSATPLSISPEEMKLSKSKTLKTSNCILCSAEITAGHVLWQKDISKLNDLAVRLKDTQEQISEDNVLLQAELELKEHRAQADEKSRLYDRITSEVSNQIDAVDRLLSLTEKQPQNTDTLLAEICVLGAYIKRRGNLLLLSENSQQMQSKELEYCIRESLDNLSLVGVYTALDSKCEGKMPSAQIIAFYDIYEAIIEDLLESINALMLNLFCKNGTLRLKLQLGCDKEINEQELKIPQFPFGQITYSVDDKDITVNVSIENGGDGDD